MGFILRVIALVLVTIASLVILFHGNLGKIEIVGIAWLGVAFFIASFLVGDRPR